MKTAAARRRGLTLVELLVVLAVLALLAAFTAPAARDYQRDLALASATTRITGLLAAARSEALRRQADVIVAPIAGQDWNSGWRLFVDHKGNGRYDDAAQLLSTSPALTQPYLSTAMVANRTVTQGYVRYTGAGFAINVDGSFGARTFEIRRNDVATNSHRATRRIKIGATGRLRLCTPTRANDSTCSMAGEAD
ncbi:MAG: hypothetical protein GAK30_02999 [Paracidovorax wautersii]|uniref:Type II secretion system protein H n=1 Tax=Paracidovorax wautersii TaxID=1177982 RepID=A0A7V8FM37_9BURK|nr:MAG: hypothetical protein GAK30_02999 [Paracidovorax wautersii]